MQNKLKKFKDALESKPTYLIEQNVIFPIFSFDLSGEIDSKSIVERALPFRKSNDQSYKPDLVKNGYQTQLIGDHDPDIFSDLNKVIENKCQIAFNQSYVATDYWFVFYETGSEILNHSHWNLKRFTEKGMFDIYPLASAYYPLCSSKSSPIIFTSDKENVPDLVVPIKQNTLLIFNANLKHYVPKSEDDSLRLVYSCNLYKKD